MSLYNKKTVQTEWECWNYDVWGNRQDGYDVNDRSCFNRHYIINCKIQNNNSSNPALQFFSAYPSDWQLQQLFGVSCKLDVTGDDVNIYVNRESDGYPIGELNCLSHSSLSPIRLNNGFEFHR